MARLTKKRNIRNRVVVPPKVVLLVMEDYEAMQGSLTADPRYKAVKRKLVKCSQNR